MNAVFLDTGYLLALELSNDQNHQAARRHWQGAINSLPPLVTTSYVFSEVVTFFNSRSHHMKAVQIGNNLLRSPSVQLIHIDEQLFHLGWAYFQQHQDKMYSLTDCISFVVMQKLGIRTALPPTSILHKRASGCVTGCLVIKTHILRVLAFLL